MFTARLRHLIEILHYEPGSTADESGQLILDDSGQPIGDNTSTVDDDWTLATTVRAMVAEKTSSWPDGVGAGAQIVMTKIFLEGGVVVDELDKLRRIDVEPNQVYQVAFVNDYRTFGHLDHIELMARRIPL